MTNPDRDGIDQETTPASNHSSDSSPEQPAPAKRKPVIRYDAKPGYDQPNDPDTDQDANGQHRRIKPPRKATPPPMPDLAGKQQIQGKLSGDRYVRVVRQHGDDFQRAGPGHLVATEESIANKGAISRGYIKLKRFLIGQPLTTASAAHERLSKVKALAVLSSDALSSVAYATEEILRVLLVAGGLAVLDVSLPIGAAIILLLIIVGTSYRQTIKAYPNGGGSYIVAKDNLGDNPALLAGSALLVAYLLTVAVSIAASVAALISAFPELRSHRVALGIAIVMVVTLLNLRGIRESGSIFAVPTYLFLIGMAVMITVGFVRTAMDGFAAEPVPPQANELAGAGALGLFVVLRAFSSGCAALTGVEAISDGVPAFKPPEWRNARATLTIMISILAVSFAGITFLAHQFGTYPMEAAHEGYETVVSQIARHTFGGSNAGYYYIQFATMGILVLGANTAYSDFPRLSYFLARDRFMPRQFTFRGDRLAFSTGILTLGILACVVLAIYDGEVEPLIPLYAVGVFISFTISQFAMFMRWQRRREPGWKIGRIVNLVGAIATAVVATIVGVSRFREGAWMTGVIIVILILAMRAIHGHYTSAARELATSTPLDPDLIDHTVVVPISTVNRVARQTLAYARSISDNVTAVHVSDEEDDIKQFRSDWAKLELPINLVIIESPYRQLVGPLLRYIDEIDKQRPNDTLTVVLPEFIARHWWEHLLHNQTALRLKAALLFRPGTVVTSVPYHLERS
jgi:amino acid transporter